MIKILIRMIWILMFRQLTLQLAQRQISKYPTLILTVMVPLLLVVIQKFKLKPVEFNMIGTLNKVSKILMEAKHKISRIGYLSVTKQKQMGKACQNMIKINDIKRGKINEY